MSGITMTVHQPNNDSSSEHAMMTQAPRRLPMQDVGEPFEPTVEWGLDKLAEFAIDQLGQVTILAKRSTVVLFRAGRALTLAQEQIKEDRAWGKWLKAKGIPRTTAWEVIELFKRGESEEVVSRLIPNQALKQLGIRKAKKTAQPRGATNRGNGGEKPPKPPALSSAADAQPPKEDSRLLELTMIRNGLDYCYEKLKQGDLSSEEAIACMKMIDEIYQSLDNVINEVHARVVINKVS